MTTSKMEVTTRRRRTQTTTAQAFCSGRRSQREGGGGRTNTPRRVGPEAPGGSGRSARLKRNVLMQRLARRERASKQQGRSRRGIAAAARAPRPYYGHSL